MKGDDVELQELLCSEAIRVSFGLKGMLCCLPNHKVQGFVQKSSRMKNAAARTDMQLLLFYIFYRE